MDSPVVEKQPSGESSGSSTKKIKAPKTAKPTGVTKKKESTPSIPNRAPIPYPKASFELVSTQLASSPPSETSQDKFAPRIGALKLERRVDSANEHEIILETPGMICGASRGMVKHLSRDNLARATGVDWIHVPFEDFLELPTPVPILHPASLPLHTFLGHPPDRHIVSLSLRDPADNQNMPANTNAWVQAKTVRGVRKVSVVDWINWCKGARPDLVWAFVDVPKSLLGGEGEEAAVVEKGQGRQISQKRITKCVERSTGWIQAQLAGLREPSLAPTDSGAPPSDVRLTSSPDRPPIVVPLLGGCDPRAREEYSRNLVEKQDAIDIQKSGGLQRLNDGIFAYSMDMVDLPTNQLQSLERDEDIDTIEELLQASLEPLPSANPRIAHSSPSPHVILRLISDVGYDLFDAPFATEAADLGIVLDFHFPAQDDSITHTERSQIGWNLFEERFASDFTPLGGQSTVEGSWPDAPTFDNIRTLHSPLDSQQWTDQSTTAAPYTKAYIHHLLHTHEMGAYALLHLHNLAVVHTFFKHIRQYLLTHSAANFKDEVIKFYARYESPERLFDEARVHWKEVELARGKGRMKREREAAATLAPPLTGDPAAVAEGIEDTV